jgi:hypothetical protein
LHGFVVVAQNLHNFGGSVFDDPVEIRCRATLPKLFLVKFCVQGHLQGFASARTRWSRALGATLFRASGGAMAAFSSAPRPRVAARAQARQRGRGVGVGQPSSGEDTDASIHLSRLHARRHHRRERGPQLRVGSAGGRNSLVNVYYSPGHKVGSIVYTLSYGGLPDVPAG